MSSDPVSGIRAVLLALSDRTGRAFRKLLHGVSDYSERNEVAPSDVADLAAKKAKGYLIKDYEDAINSHNDAELKKIEIEFLRQTAENRLRRDAAEAELAEVNLMTAKVDLARKLMEIGVTIKLDQGKILNILERPAQLTSQQPDLGEQAAPKSP